jgi:hypothetical protein
MMLLVAAALMSILQACYCPADVHSGNSTEAVALKQWKGRQLAPGYQLAAVYVIQHAARA